MYNRGLTSSLSPWTRTYQRPSLCLQPPLTNESLSPASYQELLVVEDVTVILITCYLCTNTNACCDHSLRVAQQIYQVVHVEAGRKLIACTTTTRWTIPYVAK